MKLWLSMLAVSAATSAMKASGPLALGNHQLPVAARRLVTLLAPALLAALIVVDLGGADWADLDSPQVLGVAVAGTARAFKSPMLVAVICGVTATALLRLL